MKEVDLENYRKKWVACSKCPLHETRQNTVLGYGNPNARIFVVSDKPGTVEDETGVPMTGKAGAYYQQTLQLLGLTLDDVWTTNCTCCLAPDFRDPYAYELAACKERLIEELLLVDPYIIIVMGKITMESLLGRKDPISKMQLRTGILYVPSPIGIKVQYPWMITYNPAIMLRNPSMSRHQPWHYFYKVLESAVRVTNLQEAIYNGLE